MNAQTELLEAPEQQKLLPVRYPLGPEMIVIREHIANHGETPTKDLIDAINLQRAIDTRHGDKPKGRMDIHLIVDLLARMEGYGLIHRVRRNPSTWVLRSARTRPDRP